MGTSSSDAMTKAPFLKRVIRPFSVRLPSGKMKIELPVASTFLASCIVWAIEETLVSSTKMKCAASQALPTIGMLRSSCFITHLKGIPI